MIKNKRGLGTVNMFIFIFAAFFMILFLGIVLFIFNQINAALDIDVDIGQVNLRDVNSETFGKINTGFVNNADVLGVMMLLGMSLLMILNGFFIGQKSPKIFLVIDILILVFVFITAVYLSQTYETFINSTSVLDLYIDDLPKSSKFILNLPLFVGTLGALVMIFTYAGLNKERGELNVQGF